MKCLPIIGNVSFVVILWIHSFAYFKREKESRADHTEKWHKLETVLNGLSKSHYISAQAE